MTKAEYLERERRKAELKARPRLLPSEEYMTVTIPMRPMFDIQDEFFALMAMFPLRAQRQFWGPVKKKAHFRGEP